MAVVPQRSCAVTAGHPSCCGARCSSVCGAGCYSGCVMIFGAPDGVRDYKNKNKNNLFWVKHIDR